MTCSNCHGSMLAVDAKYHVGDKVWTTTGFYEQERCPTYPECGSEGFDNAPCKVCSSFRQYLKPTELEVARIRILVTKEHPAGQASYDFLDKRGMFCEVKPVGSFEEIIWRCEKWNSAAPDSQGGVVKSVIENLKKIFIATNKRTCNRHADCDAADLKSNSPVDHCHDKGCDECFGNKNDEE